jgi:hypothetical protein
MKQNCFMKYAIEDSEAELEKLLPTKINEDFLNQLGIPPSAATTAFTELYFAKIRTGMAAKFKIMNKALSYERQQYQVCQKKDMEYLRLYSGNALVSDETTKRMAFWDKVKNTNDNQVKQQANKQKSTQNAASADFRKNRGNGQQSGQNSNQNGNKSGGEGYQGNKPWVEPWARQNSDSSHSNNAGNTGGNNSYQKSFTPKKCPKCLENHHGNNPCKA